MTDHALHHYTTKRGLHDLRFVRCTAWLGRHSFYLYAHLRSDRTPFATPLSVSTATGLPSIVSCRAISSSPLQTSDRAHQHLTRLLLVSCKPVRLRLFPDMGVAGPLVFYERKLPLTARYGSQICP